MREIKNNVEITKVNKIENKVKAQEACADKNCVDCEKEIKDFANPKMEALGRSQVAKKGSVDEDIAVMMDNPEKVGSADKFFDLAFAKLQKEGDENAFETAALLTGVYSKEVLGLK